MRNKTNRENTHQRKQSHPQDNIYMVRQFAYVHEVAGISLLSGKNIEYNLRLLTRLIGTTLNHTTALEIQYIYIYILILKSAEKGSYYK